MSLKVAELYADLGLDMRGFDRKLAGLDHQTARTGGRFGALGTMVKAAFAGAAAYGVYGLGRSILTLNADMEQNQVAFKTMLGSGEKAKAFLGDLQKFAASTPFEFTELTTVSKRMMALGFASKEVVPDLTTVGNAVSALGGGTDAIHRVMTALGQMRMKGKVSAEEMMQLTENSIPAWDYLSKAIGKSKAETMKLAEQGKISGEQGVGAILEMMAADPRFEGMMAKQSKTLAGQWSNLMDSLKQGATQLMPIVLPLAKTVTGLLVTALQAAQPYLQAFGDWFTANGPGIAEQMRTMWAVVGPVLRAVATYFGKQLRAAMPMIRELLDELVATVESVVGCIREHWRTIGPVVMAVWRIVESMVKASLKVIANVIGVVMAVIRGDWGDAWNHVKKILRAAWEGIKTVVRNALSALKTILTGLGGKILDWIGDLGGLLKDAGEAIIQGLLDGIKGKFEDVKDFVTGIGDWIGDHKGPLDYDRRLLVPHGQAIIGGLMAGIDSQLGALYAQVGGIGPRLGVNVMPQVAFAGTAALGASPAASRPRIIIDARGSIFGADAEVAIARMARRGEEELFSIDTRTSGGGW